MKTFWLLLAIAVLISSVSLPVGYFQFMIEKGPPEDFFFGVTFGGNKTSEAKLLIDRVKDYTNLFVVDSWDIATNESALTEVTDYAVQANLNIIVYFDFIFINASNYAQGFSDYGLEPFHTQWLNASRDKYGDKFLGVYLSDEPGGKQIDYGHPSGNLTTLSGRPITTFRNLTGYSDAANRFVRTVGRSQSMQRLINSTYPYNIANTTHGKMPVFTADNTLYWFDYLSNYDVVFAELGWNHNIQQHIALCRGAATVQNKMWGAIITWAYNEPPYLSTGAEMLQDMQTAFSVGAKYIIVFNFPQINPYGALTDEHFSAMKTFWDQIHSSPRTAFGEIQGKVAFVLPKDYGWGMRQPNDKIWGYWPADELSLEVGKKMQAIRNTYGLEFDAVYDDARFNLTDKYAELYYWNSTIDFSSLRKPDAEVNYGFYTAILAPPIAVVGVVSLLFLRRRKQSTLSMSIPTEPEKKTTSRNLDKVTPELAGDKLVFHVTKGRLKKRDEITKEIPLADIENVNLVGKVFTVTSQDSTEIFRVEDSPKAEATCKVVVEALENRRKTLQAEEDAKHQRNKLAQTLGNTLETVDFLFDILMSLHDRINWNQVDSCLKHFEASSDSAQGESPPTLNLASLSAAVQKREPKSVSKEALSLLQLLLQLFKDQVQQGKVSEQLHPNLQDAEATILSYYRLNDIALAATVGDKDTAKEIEDFTAMLDNLAKAANFELDLVAFKSLLDKLALEEERSSLILESRAMFRQQVGTLLTSSRSQIRKRL